MGLAAGGSHPQNRRSWGICSVEGELTESAARSDPEFDEDLSEVVVDGAGAEKQMLGYLAVG